MFFGWEYLSFAYAISRILFIVVIFYLLELAGKPNQLYLHIFLTSFV